MPENEKPGDEEVRQQLQRRFDEARLRLVASMVRETVWLGTWEEELLYYQRKFRKNGRIYNKRRRTDLQ